MGPIFFLKIGPYSTSQLSRICEHRRGTKRCVSSEEEYGWRTEKTEQPEHENGVLNQPSPWLSKGLEFESTDTPPTKPGNHFNLISTAEAESEREEKMRAQIVLFGDSITEQSFRSGGWGASLADTYSRKADVLVRGYGGYNTRWALFLLHHIFPLDSIKHPLAVTIFFGANDAALKGRTSERQHVPVDEYKENLMKIIQHLKKCSPTMLVVLITPPPVDEDGRKEYAKSIYGEKAMELPERTNEMAGVYARQCVELAKDLGIHSVDIWSKMQETEGWQKKFLSDGLHLTPEGNAVVSKEVVRVFNEAWLSAAEMPYDFPHHSEIDGKSPEKAFQQRCI